MDDDLLTYDLGEIDESESADEDLLLSDEESPSKLPKEHEEKLLGESESWVNDQLAAVKQPEAPIVEKVPEEVEKRKEPEPIVEEPVSQSEPEHPEEEEDDKVTSSDQVSSQEHHLNECTSDTKTTPQSDINPSRNREDFDADNDESEDVRERRNPKTSSERKESTEMHPRPSRGGGGGGHNYPRRNRGGMGHPRGNHGGGGGGRFGRGGYNNQNFHLNENQHPMDFNPMMRPGGGGGGGPGPGPMMGMRPDFRPNPQQMPPNGFGNPQFQGRPMPRGPFDQQKPPQMFGNGGPPNFGRPNLNNGPPNQFGPPFQGNRPMNPGGFGPGPMQGPGNPQQPPGMGGGPPFNRMPMPQQQFGPGPGGPFQSPPHAMPPHNGPPQPQIPLQPINLPPGPPGLMPQNQAIPRKVLINPNFKGGGVQAAATQLMRDTLNNPQLISGMGGNTASDEALLRQQEAFINQNRMHIEKRRHHHDRSPDRDRDRDYSPPRRRAHSRDRHLAGRGERHRISPKRRRSGSFERDGGGRGRREENQPAVEEDEETRAYRLQIEKQKAMREKILRDKEMRRRKAAEEKAELETTEKKSVIGEEKLTPIVVTERKIISLKKNPAPRALPTAKVLPETKPTTTMAVVKPVVKADPVKSIEEDLEADLENWDEEEMDEDALLADSPPPSQETNTPPHPPMTRRVVLTSRPEGDKPKGVFNRLEKRIGVNEAAKKKLQRIVIKNVK